MSKSIAEFIPEIRIFEVRCKSVIIDSDLAEIYGVETKVFNQAVKRNLERFPDEFSFILTEEEITNLRSQNATSNTRLRSQIVTSNKGRGGRRYNPRVFTEHGALMASTILKSERAVAMSIYVIRAFVEMREHLMTNAAIFKRLAEVDKKLLEQDNALWDIYQKLLPLLQPDEPEAGNKRMGFVTD